MSSNEKVLKAREIVDSIRRVLTTVDVNIGPSATEDDHKEAMEAAQSLDTYSALLTQELKGLNNVG